jgi:DUF1680 family protein
MRKTQADYTHRAVIVDTSNSPHARLKPVPLTAVSLADSFWAPRLRINAEVTLPDQYRLLEETGRVDNFRRAAGKKELPFTGRYFNDSDIYKWVEAAAWTLAAGPNPRLQGIVAALIEEVAAAQGPDGYLDTYFTHERATERWTNLRDMHELYCAGHLIQAAVAHHRATGGDELLDVACRLADHICQRFGPPEMGQLPGVPGHEEIEMALVELARETGVARYREQAAYFLDARGQGLIGGAPYHQDHQPLREMGRLTGHAVRALYLTAGAADLVAESGDASLLEALERLWGNMTARQMYISGGVGSRHAGEAFGADFELPNARAYAETCAAIANVMWNWRMLSITAEARFADLVERALYNGVLPGVSLDGRSYYYENPLADDGTHRRHAWFDCACCPPNLARLLAGLPGYFCSQTDAGIWVHLYAAGTARVSRAQGEAVTLCFDTRYPWGGRIEVEVQSAGSFGLFLRIPAWCAEGASVEINGQPFSGPVVPGSYAALQRLWRRGDQVRLHLPMPVRALQSHPHVMENRGRVALMRGPLLYCAEAADNPGFDLRDAHLRAGARFEGQFRPDLLGGVLALRTRAVLRPPAGAWAEHLYRPAGATGNPAPGSPVDLVAIPYYAWANREPGRMQVWFPQADAA